MLRSMRPYASGILFVLSGATVAVSDEPGASTASLTVEPVEITAPKYIFAAEDTLEIPAFFKMSPLEITADRLRIGEIVDRCIRREEELREQIRSHTYTQYVKTVNHVDGYGEDAKRRIIFEQVDRVTYRAPEEESMVTLKLEAYQIENAERTPYDEEDDPSIEIRYRDLNDLPFYLEDRDDYSFEILAREIVGDRVIYEVELTPKSDFEIAPRGRIWVDTTNFQIVREEFDFEGRVPFPLFIKSLGPFIRERERVGDVWVWRRFLIRVDTKPGLLKLLDKNIPSTVEFVVLFRDHAVNALPEEGDG